MVGITNKPRFSDWHTQHEVCKKGQPSKCYIYKNLNKFSTPKCSNFAKKPREGTQKLHSSFKKNPNMFQNKNFPNVALKKK